MRESLNLPNLFTLLRLALAPFVIRAILGGHHRAALLLFAVAAVTDAIDGELARRLHSTTQTGAYLDPIADKVLLSGVYVALVGASTIPWWFVILIFGRDVLILAMAGYALLFTGCRKFPPSLWGKLSTLLQVVTAVAWMVSNAGVIPGAESVARALIWPAAAATFWSGAHYGWRGLRMLRTD